MQPWRKVLGVQRQRKLVLRKKQSNLRKVNGDQVQMKRLFFNDMHNWFSNGPGTHSMKCKGNIGEVLREAGFINSTDNIITMSVAC